VWYYDSVAIILFVSNISFTLMLISWRSQLEKSMEKTEERGWYVNETTWLGLLSIDDSEEKIDADDKPSANPDDIANNETATILADEARSKCILCGISFAMLFDQEDGEWKYKNCIEKDVLKEDDGPTLDEEEFEAVLVHKSCWDGLGRPEFLTPDQVLHGTNK
jgi:pre-mRNA cleavage complex 2 protein Pcf11